MQRTARIIASLAVASLAFVACSSGTEPTNNAAGDCTTDKLATSFGSDRVSTFGAAATAVRPLAAQAKPTVKMGYFGDLTGANSSLVIGSREGAALAVKAANAAGNLKVNIEFVPKDNKDASGDTAPSIEQGFIQDASVVGVMGGAFSGETRAVGKLFKTAGLAHVSPSATGVDLTTFGWPFYRVLPNDDVQGPQAGDLVSKVLGCKNVAVIDDKSEYGAGLAKVVAETIEKNDGTVVVREGIEPTKDYTTVLDTIVAKSPDAVFYGGYDSELSLIVPQARAKGYKGLIISGDGSKGDKLLKVGKDADGVIVACPCLDPNVATGEAAKKFTADFTTEYGKAPGIYAAEGWDAAQVFIAAIDASDDDGTVTREEILAAVPKVEFQGITKAIKFTDKGEVEDQTIFAYIVKDGKYSLAGAIGELG